MSTTKKKDDRPRLNQDLCVDQYEICVPKKSRLLGNWEHPDAWKEYVEELAGKELPGLQVEDCCSCDCQPGRKLRGDLAVKHAARVHEKIHRQVLSLEQVSAVDIGFAISERETKFWPFLAIRVHVNKKRSPEQLLQAGLSNLTDAAHGLQRNPEVKALMDDRTGDGPEGGLYAFPPHDRDDATSGSESDPDLCICCDWVRYRHLMQLLSRELGQGQDIREKRRLLRRYPIGGIHPEDLSIFCPWPIKRTQTLQDVRLCISGVPIDIINAEYNPSISHPGGDANSGVFADPPKRSNELEDDEHLLIGRGRVNPLVGGVSVGSITGQAGTLGTIVWDRTDGTPCVLSNWHVLAGTPTAQVGQPTYQPALFDGGSENDVVANLKRWHLGEEGDAALAELSHNRHYASGEILGLWHPISGYIKPELNLEVRKWGRTTGFTEGFIDGIHLATNIDYGNGVIRFFKDQFHIAPIYAGENVSQTGDSGSLVVTSFAPLEQRRDLEALKAWLLEFCKADSLPNLCKQIHCKLTKLVAKVNGSEIGTWCIPEDSDSNRSGDPSSGDLGNSEEPGRELLRDYMQSSCGRVEPLRSKNHAKELCELFTKILAVLQSESFKSRIAALRKKFKARSRAKAELARLRDALIHGQLQIVFAKKWLKTIYCVPDSQGCLFDIGKCYKGVQDIDALSEDGLCKFVERLYECLQEDCKALRDCLNLYSRLCRNIEKWRRQSCEIAEAQRRRGLFCEDLIRCAKLRASSCCCDCPPDAPKSCCTACPSMEDLACLAPSELLGCIEATTGCRLPSEVPPAGPGDSRIAGASSDFFTIFRKVLDELREPTKEDLVDHVNDTFEQLLSRALLDESFLKSLLKRVKEFRSQDRDEENRNTNRAYYAVGMLFAGDTPGSPFGEFAVASDIEELSKELRFSLRPVFEPRSSFRELRVRPDSEPSGVRAFRSRRGFVPGGAPGDPRSDGGPQPDPLTTQPDPDNRL